MSETFQRPDKSFFQHPKKSGDLINKGNFVHKYLQKQMDIDKILEVIQTKVLKGTHLPMEGYLCSPYLKDLYLYLSQNKLPSSKSAIRKLETLAEKYVLLDSLFSKYHQKKRLQFWQYQKCVQTKLLFCTIKICLQDTKELLKLT